LPVNFFGKGGAAIKNTKGPEEAAHPDKKSPRTAEDNKIPFSARNQIIDPNKVERTWHNIPKKIQGKILSSDVKESEIKDQLHMDMLWEVIRWMYPDHFVQPKYPPNPSMHALAALGEKSVHELDIPLRKLYKFQESSGNGGYGRTTVAKDKKNDKTLVVLKRVKHARDSDKLHNLIEVGALSSCDHPNIVTFYDAFVEMDGKKQPTELWIAMEYMQGGTLREASEGCRLTEKHLAFFLHVNS